MKRITSWLNDSLYLTPLSPACKMCAHGSKMVILITGLCPAKCFYCPLSYKKGGKDRIFADEWELDNEKDTKKMIKEAEYINATGAGITGGEPLVVWDRVKKYILLLKDTFGSEFHIHLYTSGLKNANHISELISSGLDEVRFHPFPENWSNMDKSLIKKPIKDILDSAADIAIEIPAIPDLEKEMFYLVKWADENELNWVNLNELEYSERNCESLISKGYEVKNEISAAVKGSQDSAIKVLRRVKNENLDIGVHYCSLSFKDGIQLRNRIKRRASNIAKEYEVITEDGTLVKGVVDNLKLSSEKLINLIKEEFAIPEKYFYYDKDKNRVEIGLWILEKISADLRKIGYKCYMIEEYPTADRLEVERIPMPF